MLEKIASTIVIVSLISTFTFTVTPLIMDIIKITENTIQDTTSYYKLVIYKKLLLLCSEKIKLEDKISIVEVALIYAKLNNDTRLYNELNSVLLLLKQGSMNQAQKLIEKTLTSIKSDVENVKDPQKYFKITRKILERIQELAKETMKKIDKVKTE